MKNVMKGLGLSEALRDKESPVVKAGFLSKLTLWWLNKHVWVGFKRPLAPHNIHTVPPNDKSVHRALKLRRYWDELTPDQQRKPQSLLKATVQSNWKVLCAAIILILLGEVCKFVQPFLIAEIVIHFKGKGVSEYRTWGFAAGMVGLMVVYSVLSTYGEYLGQVVAMRMRASCTALLTRKATRLSSKGLSELSAGLVINLLASDVEKFYNAATEFRGLFGGPVVLLTLLVMMIYYMRMAVIPAVAFVILLTGLRFIIGNISSKLRLTWAERTDYRILVITEVVSSMLMVKSHCWESLVEKRLKDLRRKEIKSAGLTMLLNGLNLNLGHVCDRVVTFLVILSIILSGDKLDYKTAIQVLVWMKMGQLGFVNFPIGYSMWKQMEASLSRIQDFLIGEENMTTAKILKETKVGRNDTVHIKLTKASASWSMKKKNESELEKMMKATLLKSIAAMSSVASNDMFVPSGTFSLRNVSLYVENGMHVGIIGRTGSGKTSLLLTMLGSLPLGGGSRSFKGRVAYVPQKPWIRCDAVRNNILMGETMHRAKYAAVLKACALQKDVTLMHDGDLTMVGDRGSSLSGGQRARISLARAVYRDADIYILDDPFSSLDAKITNHVFHECCKGLLKDKLVILATNNCSLLQYTDLVIALNEGRVEATGTMEEVARKIKVDDFLGEPVVKVMDKDECADVFEKHDKASMLMSLLSNQHIKKEHAHVPKRRATPFSVYLNYWLAGRGYVTMLFFALFLLAQQVCSILGEWWMVYNISGGYKSKSYGKKHGSGYGHGSNSSEEHHESTSNDSFTTISHITQSLFSSDSANIPTVAASSTFSTVAQPSFVVRSVNDTVVNLAAAAASSSAADVDQTSMLWQYAVFVGSSVLLGLLAVCMGTSFTVLAAKNLYNNMFDKVMRAPITTFSGEKAGEMVNRFARDTGRMDDIIPLTIYSTFLTAAIIISHTCYICVINYYVVIASIPYFGLVVLFILYCVRAIRDTKRLESEFRTPSFKHLQHILTGLEVIRAFGMEGFVIKEADSRLDRHTSAWSLYIGSMYWMKMRLNLLVTLYLAGVLAIAFLSPHDESAASPLGLSLSYILVFMGKVQYCAMYSAMLDANMTSVEHISEYDQLQSEAAVEKDCAPRLVLPPCWPAYGCIKFTNVHITYPGKQTSSLSNLSFTIKGGEKVGIVGRTGAGKSTVFNLLLRLYDYAGVITIDECNIRGIGLHDLRSSITFLLQEAVLHSGTIRYNLDPYSRFTDRQIWIALEKVKMKTKIIQLPGQLNMEIEANGNNFSAGQRQLLCMARALLNMHKIMLVDEITANVDKATAQVVSKVLADEFKGSTILNISHDLEWIMNYDKILVIEAGKVTEFNHPHLLLQNVNGPFQSLIQPHGSKQVAHFTRIAKESYFKQQQETQLNTAL